MGIKICLGCMKEIGDVERCPYCGFSKEDNVPLHLLKPKTVLKNRYIVGKMLKTDGEGITYIGFDCKLEKAVNIREYMPGRLCVRQGEEIVPQVGCEAKFKALKSDFWDLYQHLLDLKILDNIIQVYDLFEQNQTVYAIYDQYDFITLNQYVNANAGELDWEEASSLFKPVFESLAVIHNSGVIHRGLSPETIVLSNNRLLITDFAICSERVANSELDSQLYKGYAAPEQYAKMIPHGEWTDVYGVCAVLYKVLSGTMPPEAPTRSVNDNLIPLSELNDTVPRDVSKAIASGMVYAYQNRTHNMRDLVTDLYHAKNFTISATISNEIYDTKPMGMNQQTRVVPPEDKVSIKETDGQENMDGKKPVQPWKKVVLICLPFVLVIAFLLYWVMIGFGCESKPKDDVSSMLEESSEMSSEVSSEESSSEASSEVSSEVSSEPDNLIVVDNFVKQEYEVVISSSAYEDVFVFGEPTWEYSETIPEGYIIDQSVSAGSEVEEGTTITFTVSKGSRYITLNYDENSFIGQRYENAAGYFTDQGCNVSTLSEPSDTVSEGCVTRIEGVLPGAKIDRDNPPSVTVYYSSGTTQS